MKSPAPAPKSNLIQMMMIGAMIFLGFQLFMGPKNNQDKRNSAEQLTDLQTMNAELRDMDLQMAVRKYEQTVRAEGKSSGKSREDIDSQVMQGYVLLADATLKSGLYRTQLVEAGKAQTDYGYKKIRRAYDSFKPKFEAFHKKDVWQKAVAVTPTDGRPQAEVTPEQIYEDIKSELSPLAESQPVIGFIPGYKLIDILVQSTGAQPWLSYTLAAFFLAVVVRAIVWPLAQKQFIWGRRMQQLQPMLKEIQAKYKDKKTGQIKDQAGFQTETMALYKKYGLNPFAGCGPALIQMPLFLIVYQCMRHYEFEFTKGYFLWIHPGSTSFLGLNLAPNLGERDYWLVVVYGISMIVTTLMMPVSDPANAKQGKLMGLGIAVFFTITMFFYPLPSAFILYWIFTNILSTTQSLLVHRMELEPLQPVASETGGVIAGQVVEKGAAAAGTATADLSKNPGCMSGGFMKALEQAQQRAQAIQEEQGKEDNNKK